MAEARDKTFVAEHLKDDLSRIALRIHGRNDLDVPWILQQIAGYQTIEKKLPTWYKNQDIVFPVSLPLEQCSSEATALYKRNLVCKTAKRGIGADLTGGFGVDTWAISELFDTYNYVERNAELCNMARDNFKALGRNNIEICNADAQAYLEAMPPVDFIFMDPARRDNKGGKVVQLSDCEPDITKLFDTLRTKTRFLLLKLSPMLDISLAMKTLPNVREIHIVAVDNDCKELLFLLDFKQDADKDIPITAVNLSNNHNTQRPFAFSQEQEEASESSLADRLCHYLYEPNVAILKGGAFKQVGATYHLDKLHINTHLYTSDHMEETFPGKIFEVEKVLRPSAKETKTQLQQVAQANVCVRNYPEPVDTLRKRFHLKDGGDHYLYGLTIYPNEHLLVVCRRILKDIVPSTPTGHESSCLWAVPVSQPAFPTDAP